MPVRLAASPPPRWATSSTHLPFRDLVSSQGPYRCTWTGSGRSTAPGTSSSPARRARPTTGRPQREGHVQHGRQAARRAWPRWASTSSTCRPSTPSASIRKGPNNTLTPGRGRPRLALGDRLQDGGHDAIHPGLGTLADFDAFVARADELGLEVALDLAFQAARPPLGPSIRSGSPPARTARSRTRRTRPRSTRTSIRSTSTPTAGPGHEVLRVVRFWMEPRRAHLPRRQPAHQAADVLGVADRRGPQDRPRRHLPL